MEVRAQHIQIPPFLAQYCCDILTGLTWTDAILTVASTAGVCRNRVCLLFISMTEFLTYVDYTAPAVVYSGGYHNMPIL